VSTPAPTERTTLRRLPARGDHDRSTIAAILDEALICHLGLVDPEGRPFVIPTIHARVDDTVYLHGSPANRALRAAGAEGVECCVTATIVDGLVLARSTFHHSMNYRSVVIYGTATRVEDPDEKTAALEALVEHVLAGRGADARHPNEKELKGTLVLRLPIDEASAKVRTGRPLDDEEDMDLAVWAGHVPLRVVAGDPVPDPDLAADVPWPGYDLSR
jgi:nitroimidazol reductase NimA-like FMN-containing flavoprotein (pyridoxamine 5'-phosphate oxidase superfamily)